MISKTKVTALFSNLLATKPARTSMNKAQPSLTAALLGAGKILGLIGTAFILAQIVAASFVPVIMNIAHFSTLKAIRSPNVATFTLESRPNFHNLAKAIRQRNLFNATGEFPKEELIAGGEDQGQSAFDINAPCRETKVTAISLVGIIQLHGRERDSIAVVQEKGVKSADIYKIGDYLIGQENVQVAGITTNMLILNNNGAKECLRLEGLVDLTSEQNPATTVSKPVSASHSSNVLLQSEFVREQLGDSFSGVINSARLVPNLGQDASGFKIFAIKKDSLFDKIGLQDGDIITQVNDTVLEAAEGFAFYKAFEDEAYIRISLLRGGEIPTTITVQIK